MSRMPTPQDDAVYTGSLAAHNFTPDVTQAEGRTELANAKRFIEHHGEKVRFVPPWDKWIVNVGTHWQLDDGCLMEQFTRDVIEQVWAVTQENLREVDASEAKAMLSFAKATSSASGIDNCLTLARSEQGIPISHHALDSNPWLLNVQNGTIDLKTGKRQPHSKNDFITKLAPVVHTDRGASALWEQSVATWMDNNAALIEFLQRLCGLWLTGVTREHILPIAYGLGANGKSVFLGTMESLLGPDYSMHAPPNLLMEARNEKHPTERADLFGKRLVVCQETEGGSRLAESLVKELTGGDRIRARRMREDFWEFSPTHKLAVSSNYRPIVRGTDHGMWRRIRLIPFTVTIPPERQDKALPEKLKRELSGILSWCLKGCLEWQAKGLQEPACVLAATEQYRTESDIMGAFIEERCIVGEFEQVAGGRIYEAYTGWCKANGHDPDNSTVFGRKLTERGFPARKTNGVKVRDGIGLTNGTNF